MAAASTNLIRTLVIDDQSTMRSILRQLLAQIGIEDVDEASNGEEALKMLADPRADQPDVIICDLHMDKMDGMEFCNRLRRSKKLSIPVIMLTGDPDRFLHEISEQVGAVAVLTKPVSADELLVEIEKVVGFSLGPN